MKHPRAQSGKVTLSLLLSFLVFFSSFWGGITIGFGMGLVGALVGALIGFIVGTASCLSFYFVLATLERRRPKHPHWTSSLATGLFFVAAFIALYGLLFLVFNTTEVTTSWLTGKPRPIHSPPSD